MEFTDFAFPLIGQTVCKLAVGAMLLMVACVIVLIIREVTRKGE